MIEAVLWYEVWADEGLSPPYLLILQCKSNGSLEIYDPLEAEVAFRPDNYDEATDWLVADEYTLVRGRMHLD